MISDAPEIPPQPTDEEVTALETLLREHGGWMSATGILLGRKIVPSEGAKRRLRATAAESKWIISGQNVYKHLQCATPDEVKHFVAQMSSQARNMDIRVSGIEENYRKIYGVVSLLIAFLLLASNALAQTAVLFPLAQMTGTTNDTTITVKAVNNPVGWHGQVYWLPTAGIQLKTVNGSVTTNLIPNDYTVVIAGLPGTWKISVADTNVTLNAALIGNLKSYTFTPPVAGIGGPESSVVSNLVIWASINGALVGDSQIPLSSIVLASALKTAAYHAASDFQPSSPNLTNWSSLPISAYQPSNPNLTNWSALATSAKEDHSANLDLWSATTPSAYQVHSANLDLWSASAPSSYQTSLGYSPQPGSQNLTNWSAVSQSQFIPFGTLSLGAPITAQSDGAGGTNLSSSWNMSGATNLVNAPITIAGANVTVSYTTNPITGQVTNTISSSGAGGGTSSGIVSSNCLIISTNAFLWDISKVQHLTLMLATNLQALIITNQGAVTNFGGVAQLDTWEGTNGTWKINTLQVAGGLARTNGNGIWRGTNASQYDVAQVKLDATQTNALFSWETNYTVGISFTNTLPSGGGGGGGGGGTTYTFASGVFGGTQQTFSYAGIKCQVGGAPITITSLGWYSDASTYHSPADVVLKSSDCSTTLAEASVDTSAHDGAYHYASITPVTLSAGTVFYIYNTKDDICYFGATSFTLSSGISFLSDNYGSCGGSVYWGDSSHFVTGPNFQWNF